ncbi:MAG: iron-containing alcohol dehydrogenase [Ruminococcus sp.]|nr:iron-containing alcohol dehydrogenase [Ruminococcus sp.]
MRYFMPTLLYSEENCVMGHAAELAALGRHALIVTGKSSSRKNGSLEDVINALSSQGRDYTVFDRVEENPSVETVMECRDLGIACGADMVIGVGGGSPLDAAKAAALMMRHPDKGWEFMYESDENDRVPLAAVPTTCGTGSEVTAVSVITRHDLGTKGSIRQKLFPDLALSDGKYLLNAPASVIRNTAVDALSHLLESGLNSGADDFSDMTVFAGLDMWKRCRPYIEGEKDLDGRAAQMLMNASSFAGMAIAQHGTAVPHALSYLLTYEGGIPHGAAVGAFQAGYMSFADADRQKALLSAAGLGDCEELRDLINRLCPVSVSREILEKTAQVVLANPAKLATSPYPIDEKTMAKIIDI